MEAFSEIAVELSDFVATVEIRRPPHNYFDVLLVEQIASAFEQLDNDDACRAIVLASQGKSFCAGANFGDGSSRPNPPPPSNELLTKQLYREAVRLFATHKPIVAAVHGAAIGGGLGLALVADFRVTCAEARFSANFTRLGYHPGFGLTFTLPQLIGFNQACLMFYTGRRLKGDEAHALGLAELLVPQAQVRDAALGLAREIAEASPLGVTATRATMRRGWVEQVREATERELSEQMRIRGSEDFREGVRASIERRTPKFTGR
jgi:enoyl-CoA hydratase/carnithine racemase